MPLDPSQVQWDPIDPAKIQWDAPDGRKELAQNTSAFQAGTIGAGRMGDRIYEGLKQGGLGIGAILSELLPGRLKAAAQEEITKKLMSQQQMQTDNSKEYKNLETAHPVATTVGEGVTLASSPMMRVVEGAGMVPAMVNGGISAALPSAMEYGTAEERLKRAAIADAGGSLGAAAGKVVGNVAQRVMQPVKRVVSQGLDDAIAAAQRLGYQLTPGEITGNKAVQAVEARLAKTPGSSGAMQEFQQAREKALARAASGAMGESADEISPQVLAQASSRIGGEFNRLAEGKRVVLGPSFQGAIQSLQAQQATLGDFADPQVDTLVSKGMDLAGKGEVDGKAYQLIRSRLGTKANDAFKSGNSEMGQALKTVRNAFDDAAEGSMSGEDKEAWGLARKQWAALKTVEKGNVVEGGKVNMGRLKEALRSARPTDYKEGRLEGPLSDIATLAEKFKPLPDSGTAGNTFVQGMLSGGGAATGFATGGPLGGLAGAVAPVAAPWAVQKGMFSNVGRDYLTNGKQVPLELRALMDRAARVGGLGAASAIDEQ